MKITAQLTYEKVRFDEARDVHLVVSLAAPHLDAAAPRRPVCVIPVVDVSGSMAGEKLHFAKQSVMKLVDHLAPGDFCGVVVFSTQVETLAPPLELTQGGSRAVATLYQADAQEDLASMGQGRTTLAQARMTESFGAKEPGAARPAGGARPGSGSKPGEASKPGGRGLARKRSRRW